ncbi:MAG: hypothetical protein NTV31_14350, partial [Bacteroidia bacterium]|nr:hypothetical protein [Bacteroidia bacterium]
ITITLVTAQEKKSEQKIKIVITDGSGTKVVIDTLLKDGQVTDSIRLKDGKVIFIGHSGDNVVVRPHEGTEHVFVTVSSDGKETKKEVKEITIVSSDSATWTEEGEGGKIFVYTDSITDGGKDDGKYRVITKTSKGEGGRDEKIIYINEGKFPEKEMEKTFDVYVTGDDKESAVEKTRYVIAKDGIVVTVEGNDEAKVKELIQEIEHRLGVKSEGAKKKETVKVESKKTVKK